jgi:hypothetical protein
MIAKATDGRGLSAPGGLRFSVCAAVLTVVQLLLAAQPSHAMVVMKRDFPQLVARAEQIVVGTVTEIGTQLDDSGVPWTLVTLSDLTVLKGDAGPNLVLRFYGGAAGDVVLHVPDMPNFTIGERDLVFVAGNGKTVCPFVGVSQGRFHVRLDPERGTEVIEDDQGNAVVGVANGDLARLPRQAQAAARRALSLDEFRQLIADELAHPHATGGSR